jgi:hypothetical protein
VEKVGNYLKKDLAKPGYKSKQESTKRWGWLEWRSHGLPTSIRKRPIYHISPAPKKVRLRDPPVHHPLETCYDSVVDEQQPSY